MKWITEITLSNYRAFGKTETIQIPKSNLLLIYGENGSGKSSIYNAIKDFFSSSADSSRGFKLNLFQSEAGNSNGKVKVKIVTTDPAGHETYSDLEFALPDVSSNHRIPEVILANKVKGFLDYKKMLKAHSLSVPEGKQPNIFDLVLKELLAEHSLPDPKGGTTTVELLKEYNRISKILLTNKSDSHSFQRAQTELAALEVSITELLKSTLENTNDYLQKYFKNKIRIGANVGALRVIKPAPYKPKRMVEELFLVVKYAEKEIPFYQAFLNEARLSSLAVCLYLASIKTFKPADDILKVLYLECFYWSGYFKPIPIIGDN